MRRRNCDTIFKPFYRAKDVVDAQIHGNGLGLALVKEDTPKLTAESKAESEPGKGSEFTIELTDAAKLFNANEKYMRVLLVEDEEGLMRYVDRPFGSEGFDVTSATDGKAGFELARAERFDLHHPRRDAAQKERLRRLPRSAAKGI